MARDENLRISMKHNLSVRPHITGIMAGGKLPRGSGQFWAVALIENIQFAEARPLKEAQRCRLY